MLNYTPALLDVILNETVVSIAVPLLLDKISCSPLLSVLGNYIESQDRRIHLIRRRAVPPFDLLTQPRDNCLPTRPLFGPPPIQYLLRLVVRPLRY